jgi:hypothetical protein
MAPNKSIWKFPPTFTYPVTRENPYTWFSWFVIVGGICVAVLLSAINVAANGYELIVVYMDNYNSTVNQTRWTGRPPFSWFEKALPKCQTREIPVNTQFFTNNSALSYTLTSVWHQNKTGLIHPLPSLKYTNNVLENCTVQHLQVDLEWAQRNAAQQGWVTWGAQALVSIDLIYQPDYLLIVIMPQAQVKCSIDNEESPTSLNLTTSYEFFSSTIDSFRPSSFLQQPDRKKQTSLWFGQSLLSVSIHNMIFLSFPTFLKDTHTLYRSFYWLQLSTAMSKNYMKRGAETILKGSISRLA